MPNDIEFNFFGNIYYLKEKNGDISTHEVVSYVQNIINEIQIQYSHITPHKQMVLAFLRLGKESIANKKKLKNIEEGYLEETSKIIEKIDRIMEEI